MSRLAWLTPDTIPTAKVERKLCIPNDPQILGAITGALLPLTYPENWEAFGAVTPSAIAASMSAVLSSFLGDTGVCVPSQRYPVFIKDIKSQNTAGGGATLGSWQTRVLNTLIDSFPYGVTLSSNQFTLPPGLWIIKWAAPAYTVGRHQSRLFSVTENQAIAYGTSESSSQTGATVTHSRGEVTQNNVANTTYRIEHRVQATVATLGYGIAANHAEEHYTVVECVLLQ